jgi:protein O-GlcNAc transferase
MPDKNPDTRNMTTQQALELALRHHEAGRLSEAEKIYRQILSDQPHNAEVLSLLSAITFQAGDHQRALEPIKQAIAIDPGTATYHNNLGRILAAMGRLDEAVTAFRSALELSPDRAEVHRNLGKALAEQEHFQAAIDAYRSALKLKPLYPEVHYRLGNLFKNQQQLPEAIAAFRCAIQIQPDYAEAHNKLGAALQAQGQFAAAMACYQECLRLKPKFAEARNNLGNVFKELDEPDQAIEQYRLAIECKPDYARAYNNLGNALRDQGQADEAAGAYRRAVELNPDFPGAYSNLLYNLYFLADHDARAIYEEHIRWNRQMAEPLKKFIQPHPNDRDPERRLKIGYVSADFRNHSQSFFTVPLFSKHNHHEFEIFCYSNVTRADAITTRIKSYADVWRDTANLSDQHLDDLIRNDRVDILVDLTMHMANGRWPVFARKPAPVQVAWLAYPGTTGLSTMDYRLTDPYLDPPGLDDRFYCEESIRLSDAFWCYDPLTSDPEIPKVNALPAITSGRVTLGSLNNFAKINDGVLQLWARVLAAVPRSHLILLAPAGQARRRVIDKFQTEGIDAGRVEFVERKPRLDYLKLHHHFDLGLDTLPANGHTTSLDSFWMGVPVVTLAGQTAIGRGGKSILSNLGLPELIAETPEEYVEIAVKLSSDLPRLAELRRTLRQRMQASPLMDAPSFARNVEAAYRQMWRRWCSGTAAPRF